MRKEKEMTELILNIAKNDARVVGVLTSGSRNTSYAKKDIFSDYDILYLVKDISEIIEEEDWFLQFGEVLISQDSYDQDEKSLDLSTSYIKMMQFKDGNRIDLTLYNKDKIKDLVLDSNTKVILDKEKITKEIKIPKDESFLVNKPTKREFGSLVNEFFWLTPYVAKGLWRRELPYAKNIYDGIYRECLETLLGWYALEKFEYKKSLGKYNKYLEDYLPNDLWIDYQKTYVGGSYTDVWEGLLLSFRLFEKIAIEFCQKNNFYYNYNKQESENLYKYIEKIRTLPKNATSIF